MNKEQGEVDWMILLIFLGILPWLFGHLVSLQQKADEKSIQTLLPAFAPQGQLKAIDGSPQKVWIRGQWFLMPPRLDFGIPAGMNAWPPAVCWPLKVLIAETLQAELQDEPNAINFDMEQMSQWQQKCRYLKFKEPILP